MSNSPTPKLTQTRVRVVGFLKRKPGISKEEFTRRWLLHAELFKSTDMSKNILKYDQMHVNDETNALLKQMGAPTCDWDGIVIMEGESFEKVLRITTDEEYERVLVPDEVGFLDREKTQVVPLNFGVFIDIPEQ
ncbi:hypothetical protein IW261DRAFT_410457 [Armillaria novae-zelandiae]|uniref:EthD domain-containing protein n=1 Tax=Armillaria novae-zelandiae TaxID=153914 RepID=A0AA39PT86_9AGAR|nr:hypothetical protein IW261DRAFT_410457 [Armillaria novae-zelandiae]